MSTVVSSEAPAPTPAAPVPQPSVAAPAAKVTPGSKAWAEMTPEQRHEQLRGPENPRARGHSPARDMREEAAQKTAAPEQRVEPQGDAPPANAEKVKIGKYEVSEA